MSAPWSAPLAAWYARCGRHDLPWRSTRDPWAVLVSEVMLQQTPVGRVLPRWAEFLRRWPDPATCAAAPLGDILRHWEGLGYPRRARDLRAAAALVAAEGWPREEAGLRRLPGVGPYTARALLCFVWETPAALPRDTNAARVAARAGAGREAHQVPAARLDALLTASLPAGVSRRDHAFALFDLGATVCTARTPRCEACPLDACASRPRLSRAAPPPRPRVQPRYAGSRRELRGAVLRELLADPALTPPALSRRLLGIPLAEDLAIVAGVIAELRDEGLVDEGGAQDRRARTGGTRTTTGVDRARIGEDGWAQRRRTSVPGH